MRLRGSLFWGIVLIILAVLLFANQQGWLAGNIFTYFWPAIIILAGIWLLVGASGRGHYTSNGETISIPLESAQSARIKMDHGAGRLNVHSGAASAELLNGVFGSEVDYKSSVNGGQMQVKLRNSPQFWGWFPGAGSLDWDIRLNPGIPLNLKIDSGASATTLDLSDLKVVELNIDTGASSTEVTLPANAGNTLVDIDSGASSVKLNLPTGVAARIRIKTGIASVNVDSNRFPPQGNGLYLSADYATAANRADITIDTGVGSVEVR
jgi:predicted membrane protein